MKIIGTGLSGLTGSRIVALLKDSYQFENISLSTGVNITDRRAVIEKIKQSDASLVLHFSAKTDVDGCEKDKEEDNQFVQNPSEDTLQAIIHNNTAWAVNVIGTQNIVDACLETGKKILYVSTDFVFDGKKSVTDGYIENDQPNPINWYGQTKYQAEKIVQKAGVPWIILRLAYPYRASFPKKDFLRAIIDRLQNNQTVTAIEDHIMTPTYIDDIASVLTTIIEKNATGIFHVVGSQYITPYEVGIAIAKQFQFDQTLIQKTTREAYFKNRAPRPFCLAMRSDKIQELGVNMSSFAEGLAQIKAQMQNNG